MKELVLTRAVATDGLPSLAELGAKVTAMDISVAMTSKAIELPNEANVALDVREGDFRVARVPPKRFLMQWSVQTRLLGAIVTRRT